MSDIKPVSLRIRRFQPADLSHAWISKRLLAAFSQFANEQVAQGWLRSLIFSNDYHFLYAEHCVGLFQVVSGNILRPRPLVTEHFVWIENKNDAQQLADAAQFYTSAHVWATHLNAEVMIVEEMSDVPHDLIREKLGRVFIRQQQFAKV